MLRHVAGAILFGVPSRGMETQALRTIVRGQANDAIVRELLVGSGYLQSLDDRFSNVALQGRMKLFLAFETRTSPTVAVSRLLCFAEVFPFPKHENRDVWAQYLPRRP